MMDDGRPPLAIFCTRILVESSVQTLCATLLVYLCYLMVTPTTRCPGSLNQKYRTLSIINYACSCTDLFVQITSSEACLY